MSFNWNRLMAVMFVGALTACATGDDTDATDTDDTDTDTDTNVGCESGLKSPTLPAQGATGVYYRTQFAISFLAAEETEASFELVKDSDSSVVTLAAPTWSESGKDVYFSAAAALEPSTAYTLNVTFSCTEGEPSALKFTTGATGAPVVYEDDVATNKYALDLSTATIIEPAGVQSLLGSLLGQLEDAILVVPNGLEGDDLSFFGGLATVTGGAVVQDECTATIDFPVAADFSENPYFVISAPDGITLSVSDISVTLLSLELSGAFAPGGTSVEGVSLAGSIDTRDIADLLGDELGGGDGDDAVCVLLGQLTSGLVACEECPGGAGPYCLSLVAANIGAELVTGDFVVITQEEVDANGTCTVE